MESVFEALKAMEKASVIEIAARTSIGHDEVVNLLWDLKRQGRVDRHGRSWTVTTPKAKTPKPEPAPMAAETQQPAPAEKTTAEIVEAIPVFTARPDDLVIPSSRFISGEIRRTKAKLANLQKLQAAMRELRRHKNLLAGLSND